MPNGFVGPKDRWNEAEEVLSAIEAPLQDSVRQLRAVITKNYHSWPSRSAEWSDGELKRIIEVQLASETETTFNVMASAWKKSGTRLFRKQAFVIEGAQSPVLRNKICDLLMTAKRLVESWTETDLLPIGES